MAGLLEGEGHIGVHNHSQSRYGYYYQVPHISVTNTEKALLLPFKSLFGGSIRTRYKKGYDKTGGAARRTCYFWTVTHRKALDVALVLLPWLKGEKRIKAIDIIKWYTSGEHPRGGKRHRGRNAKGQFIAGVM
jgi:hypothetical protein